MIRRHVSLGEFFNYYKNKFFGHYLLKKMEPWHAAAIDSEFELHILSQEFMLWPMAVAIRTFLHYSGLSPAIIVHVEKGFDQKATDLIESKFSNLRVLSWEESTRDIDARADVSSRVKKYRLGKNPIILKLIDVVLLAKTKKVMVLGTDVLFYKRPDEIVDFVKGSADVEAMGAQDIAESPMLITESYAQKYDVYSRRAQHLNSDLLVFRHDLLATEQLEEYLDNSLEPEAYFVDMTGYAVLLTNLVFKFFPYERYHVKGSVGPETVAKHFTGPRRDELYSYGIDMALAKMKSSS